MLHLVMKITQYNLPALMKYGTLNFPDITLFFSAINVCPSKGREPHTRTYSTTPKLWKYCLFLLLILNPNSTITGVNNKSLSLQ